MQFRKTKNDLTCILGNAANGRFKVIGHQTQGLDASEVVDDNRRVQVFYGEGDFEKSHASLSGPTEHDATYQIELAVSKSTKADLAVIEDENSTPAQIAAAMSRLENPAGLVDDSFDELLELVYQILMDGRNVHLGADELPYKAKNRWVSGLRKDDPVPQGEYVVLTGAVMFTCRLTEEVTGDEGVAAAATPFDITNTVNGDENGQSGVLT
jgi:hypothetical protein